MHKTWRSSVGVKVLNGLTGFGLVGFVIMHLTGNLLLLAGAEPFNAYAHFLHTFLHGAFIYIAEAGLLAFFLIHIVAGTAVALAARRARTSRYQVTADAGGSSRKSLSSLNMIFTGLVLLVFVVLHLKHFKFGPGEAAGYVVIIDGENVRDVYRLVIEAFRDPWMAFGYAGCMLLLGLHLRHGVWSMFQSLGLSSPRLLPALNALALIASLLLAAGFIGLPLYVYFNADALLACAPGCELML